MKKTILIFLSIIIISSAHSMNLNKATIIGHKAEVTGSDSSGRAINGHLENGTIIYPSNQKNHKKSPSCLVSKNKN
jgi:hypothetical protein